MSSSNRALAAARARRSSEQINTKQPPMRNPPGQSINSHAAFAQQNMPPPVPPGKNVRIAQAQQMMQQPAMQQPAMQAQEQINPKLNKISVSDAIGLITLRLGRVENLLIEEQHAKYLREQNGELDMEMKTTNMNTIPNNMQVIEKEMITNMIARLDSLEKANRDLIVKYNKDITELKRGQIQMQEYIKNLNTTVNHRIDDCVKDIEDIESAIENITNKISMKEEDEFGTLIGEDIVTDDTTAITDSSEILDDTTQNIQIEFN